MVLKDVMALREGRRSKPNCLSPDGETAIPNKVVLAILVNFDLDPRRRRDFQALIRFCCINKIFMNVCLDVSLLRTFLRHCTIGDRISTRLGKDSRSQGFYVPCVASTLPSLATDC